MHPLLSKVSESLNLSSYANVEDFLLVVEEGARPEEKEAILYKAMRKALKEGNIYAFDMISQVSSEPYLKTAHRLDLLQSTPSLPYDSFIDREGNSLDLTHITLAQIYERSIKYSAEKAMLFNEFKLCVQKMPSEFQMMNNFAEQNKLSVDDIASSDMCKSLKLWKGQRQEYLDNLPKSEKKSSSLNHLEDPDFFECVEKYIRLTLQHWNLSPNQSPEKMVEDFLSKMVQMNYRLTYPVNESSPELERAEKNKNGWNAFVCDIASDFAPAEFVYSKAEYCLSDRIVEVAIKNMDPELLVKCFEFTIEEKVKKQFSFEGSRYQTELGLLWEMFSNFDKELDEKREREGWERAIDIACKGLVQNKSEDAFIKESYGFEEDREDVLNPWQKKLKERLERIGLELQLDKDLHPAISVSPSLGRERF